MRQRGRDGERERQRDRQREDVGSDVRKLGAQRDGIYLPLSLRSCVFIVSGARSFNASLICWSAVFRGHTLKVSHFVL